MYFVAEFSGVEKELQVPAESSWKDIIVALRSAFGSRLDVSHVVAVDDDGDECSSAIDRAPLFWKTMRALAHGAQHASDASRPIRFRVYGDFGTIVQDKSFQSLTRPTHSASPDLLRGRQANAGGSSPNRMHENRTAAANLDLCAQLWAACGTGSVETVEALVAGGADIRAVNSNGSQAIHFAAVSGSVPLITFLLSNGADVNAKNYSNFTPLHFATDCCKVDAAIFLLSRGADVHAETVEGYTPLMYICGRGTTGIFRTLQDWGVDINRPNSQGSTCLHVLSLDAAADEALVDELLELGADLEGADNQLRTPLLLAAMSNNTKIACKFIARGAALNVWDSRHALCPLFCAVSCGNLELVVHLVLRGADMTIGDNFGNKLLHAAARKGNANTVKFLIECGSPADCANRNGQRPVDVALAFGHRALVDIFANTKVVKTKDEMFFNACIEGNMELIECMLGTGWDPIPKILTCNVPVLHAACAHGHVAVAQRLVEMGVPINAESPDDGRSAFLSCCAAGQLECMVWLHANGANINATDSNGSTALHIASMNARHEAYAWLQSHGVDPKRVNSDGLLASALWPADDAQPLDSISSESRDPALLALGVADLIVAPFFTAYQSTKDMILITLPTFAISDENVSFLSCLPSVSQIKDGLNLFIDDELTKCVSDANSGSAVSTPKSNSSGDDIDPLFLSSNDIVANGDKQDATPLAKDN
jgi:ankyrin repeat protein